eukprot:c24275_g7_i1 orf=362-2197(+)
MSPKDRAWSEERSGKKRRKKKKSRKRHHSSAHSSSSSSSAESSSSSDSDRQRNKVKKGKHRKDYTSSDDSGHKHRKRRQDTHRRERVGKHCHKEENLKVSHSSKRARHSSSHADEASHDSHAANGSPRPEEIVCTMLRKFPDLANDLEQLLKMLDDGQAVDLSGLTNEHIAAYLQQLFQSLLLHKTPQGLYFLPDGTPKKTLDVLGPALCNASKAFVHESSELDRSKQDEKVFEHVANEDGLHNHDQPGPSEQKRRVLGPAMPSTEELEAAARLTEAGPSLREAHADLAVDSFIGPPPPAAVKEAESANEAERYEEVERILAPDIGNAYELLGLRVGVTADLLKKRYWKLSLLVHPDKCTHPQANQAFTALNQAFKDLQDPAKRSIIEQKIEEKETREEFEAELKAKREAAQWRKLRGEALPGDDDLLETPKVLVRDEWMTQLPPERKAGAPSQQNTFFSRSVKSGRGDTSIWTDTPLEKDLKAKMAYLEAERYATLTGDSDAFSFKEDNDFSFREDNDPATASILDNFNSAKRKTSLLEKHQLEHSKKVKKVSKKETAKPAEWSASHPWKPWDREKDLTAGRQSVNLDKSNMAENLSLRFSSSHKERSFL